jgi:hypothetical protein
MDTMSNFICLPAQDATSYSKAPLALRVYMQLISSDE